MTTRFATATTLLAVASLIAAPVAAADPGDTVTYTAKSDAPLSLVTYYDGMNDMQQLHDQSSHWYLTFTSMAANALLALTVQTTGQQVSCEINVNGSVRDQKSTAGPDALAACRA
jgi:hypothetical protein